MTLNQPSHSAQAIHIYFLYGCRWQGSHPTNNLNVSLGTTHTPLHQPSGVLDKGESPKNILAPTFIRKTNPSFISTLGKERYFKIKTEICSQGLKIDETDGYHSNTNKNIESSLGVGHYASLPQNSTLHRTDTVTHPLSSDFHGNPGRKAGQGRYFCPE